MTVNNSGSMPRMFSTYSELICLIISDDAFFQPDWAGACWGRWAGDRTTDLLALDR